MTEMAPLVLENRHTGERLMLRRLTHGGDTWLELRGTLPPHQDGPPMHIHFAEDEEGRVLAGMLSVTIDGRTLETPAGGSATIPRGAAHRWWNAGSEPLAFEGTARPVVDLDRYLQAIFEIMNAGEAGRPPLIYLAHAVLRHRRTQAVLLMPAPLQTLLFHLLRGIGTLLGRYRGTEWPGCPARCTGAPTVTVDHTP